MISVISVIVPVYNASKYLDRCIRSILSQTFHNCEILLVNDGSTDNSLEICNSYAQRDQRIKVVSQLNAGVSAARNKGLSMAIGKYVMFVDSDDYMLPGMCEIMLQTIESKDADCVICGTTETWGGLWAPKENEDYTDLTFFKKDFDRHLNTELLSPPWNKIYKRELIRKGFDTSVSFGEDLMFNLDYFKNCKKISFISAAPFYHEKANENSLVNRVYPSRLSEIEKVHSAVLDFYEGSDQNISRKYIRDIIVYYRAVVQNNNFKRKEKRTFFEKWIKTSHLKEIDLGKMSIDWKNRLLLFFVRHRLWALSELQINWKSAIKPFCK